MLCSEQALDRWRVRNRDFGFEWESTRGCFVPSITSICWLTTCISACGFGVAFCFALCFGEIRLRRAFRVVHAVCPGSCAITQCVLKPGTRCHPGVGSTRNCVPRGLRSCCWGQGHRSQPRVDAGPDGLSVPIGGCCKAVQGAHNGIKGHQQQQVLA